eukprot:7773977-Lingulodinium_polyedra.AAC.1
MRTPKTGVRMVCTRREMREPLRRQTVDSITSLCTVCNTVRNDAVESIVCHRSGSQIARLARAMRTPKTDVRM